MAAITYTAKRELVYARKASFIAFFNDLGNGAVDTSLYKGTGSATFTRATIATTVDAAGLVKQVASGVARSYYDPTTLAYLGYLAEGQRANLCVQSEDFSTTWVPTSLTVNANAIASPDGATTADKLNEAAASTSHFIAQSVTKAASAIQYSASVWVKAAERGFAYLWIDDAAGNAAWASWNLSTGAIVTAATSTGSFTGASASAAQSYPGGWWRLRLTATSNTATTIRIVIAPSITGSDTYNYLGVVNNGIYVWGSQLEAAAFASSYIPTTTVSVTRNADVLSYPSSGNASDTSGTLFAEYVPLFAASLATGGGVIALVGTGTDIIRLQRSTSMVMDVFDNGVQQCGSSLGSDVLGAINRVAMSYAVNSFRGSLNGAAIVADTSGTIGTHQNIQFDSGVTTYLFGTIRNVHSFPSQLTDAQLQEMTGADNVHILDSQYSLQPDLEQVELEDQFESQSHQPLGGGGPEVILHRNEQFVDVLTDILSELELAKYREFVTSVAAGEQFTFDAYGTLASPVDPRPAVLESKGFKPQRVGSTMLYRVPFRVKYVD